MDSIALFNFLFATFPLELISTRLVYGLGEFLILICAQVSVVLVLQSFILAPTPYLLRIHPSRKFFLP
jgi:hypothetical protein